MVVDLGTGDGRSVLARATREPGTLAIGVDAAPAAMAEASRRADRGRIANVLFLAAGVEALAGSPLGSTADLVTVTLPWGSLLRGVLGRDEAALAGVAASAVPGGCIEVLASVLPTDGIDGLVSLDGDAGPAIEAAWAGAGMVLTAMRPASTAEVRATGSTWARRLGDRPVWRLDGVRGPSTR